MNKINIRSLYSLFLFLAIGATALAQSNDSIENYYSNPKNGIKPATPKPYHDTSIVSKNGNLTVDLTGYIPDTTKVADTTPSSFQLDSRSLRRESSSLLYTWDPWDYWYYSYCDPWCYSSWGFGWDIYGPHWGYGYRWGWYHYWGTPWFYDYYYPYYYYSYYYYPNYAWYGDPSHGRNPNSGYGLISNARGGNAVGNVRGSNPAPTTNRGTVRRGGVDLNNGGRAPHGRISGSGTRVASDGSRGASARDSYGRYVKPAPREASNTSRGNVTSSRTGSNSRGSSSYGTSYGRSSSSTFRSENSTPSRSSNSSFRSNSSSSRSSSSSFRSNSSSSRSSSSSFRSSSPSRSTSSSSFRSSSSPSRSGGSTSSRSISSGRR